MLTVLMFLIAAFAAAVALNREALRFAGEVRRHDREIRMADSDLGEWIVARSQSAGRERFRIMLEERGEADYLRDARIKKLRREFRDGYRDRLRAAQLRLAQADDAEFWPHRVCRFVSRRPRPSLTAPDRLASTLDRFLEPRVESPDTLVATLLRE